jgi:hypothetical protein
MWRDDSSLTIRANPFAIGQVTSGGIPSGTFPFEISRDLVEGETLWKETAAIESDFLDFHAAPLILASLVASFLVGNVPVHVWSMKSTHRKGCIRFSILTTGGTILRGSIYGDVVMLCCVFGLLWRERLSEPIKPRKVERRNRKVFDRVKG